MMGTFIEKEGLVAAYIAMRMEEKLRVPSRT